MSPYVIPRSLRRSDASVLRDLREPNSRIHTEKEETSLVEVIGESNLGLVWDHLFNLYSRVVLEIGWHNMSIYYDANVGAANGWCLSALSEVNQRTWRESLRICALRCELLLLGATKLLVVADAAWRCCCQNCMFLSVLHAHMSVLANLQS